MPKFVEKKLKEEYGEDSDIPYKIMNSMGFMKGNKVTAKGAAAERKHGAAMRKGRKKPTSKGSAKGQADALERLKY